MMNQMQESNLQEGINPIGMSDQVEKSDATEKTSQTVILLNSQL